MNTIFDKIYVISLISNKDRQEFIKYQMKKLELEYEFVYTINFNDLKYDRFGNEIIYPNFVKEFNHLNNISVYGCALAHYQCILQAYEFGFNNVLVLEDDICFIKDKELISKYFNDIPKDCDFITYAPRFNDYDEFFKYRLYVKDNIKYDYILVPNEYESLCGGMCYGIMNRNIMKAYLESQHKKLYVADRIEGIFSNSSIKRYASREAICIDQFNRITHQKDLGIFRCYQQLNILHNYEDYYKPLRYDGSNINKLINKITTDN